MDLGITLLDNKLILASHFGPDRPSEFAIYTFNKPFSPDAKEGFIWDVTDVAAGDQCLAADELVLAIPASASFLKRIEIHSKQEAENPAFLDWLAGIHLPGALSQYHHRFIPLSKSYDDKMKMMLLFATPAEPLNKMIRSVKIGDDKKIVALPEQLGLLKVLERSLPVDDIPQAAIIKFGKSCITAVLMRGNNYLDSNYFQFRSDNYDELAADIETYLLSQADPTEPLPLVLIGQPDGFQIESAVFTPPFLEIKDIEFAISWGVAEFNYSHRTK